ncbi:MAG: membrane protein insertion efficiency factor YidD [Chloroflexi bacterium]|nr:membrane protein insertion efficiency factor YidD [Chloroflexota bacterium]
MGKALAAVVRLYQRTLSPALPPLCRFQPTCSHYGVEALEKHGAIKGSWLIFRRLARCTPFFRGGYDPVP